MQTTLTPSWQHLAAIELDHPQTPRLRMSSAGKCPRRLAYAYLQTPESDPPNQHSLNRMAMGHMAEVLIVRSLHEAGWETDHTVLSDSGQLELSLTVPGTDVTLTGHPDGICRHPQFTNNLWFPLECKSMSIDRAVETEQHGVAAVYPDYLVQIALYSERLYEMGLTHHPLRGIFAMMDRDGRPLAPQRIPWEDSIVPNTLEKVSAVVTGADAGELPERPYPASSTECTFCPYYSLCRTPQYDDPQPPEDKPTGIFTEDPALLDAARKWAALKPQIDQHRDTLQEACNMADQVDIIGAGVVAGYFHPRPTQVYDPDKLRELVPDDVLKRCRINQSDKKGFWVRTQRW